MNLNIEKPRAPNFTAMAGENSTQEAALLELGHFLKESGYRFITVTPATHARVNARMGNEWSNDLAGIFGWSRTFSASILPQEVFEMMRTAGLLKPCGEGWRSLARASTLGQQLFFHSAFPTEDADAVFFGPDTYRFAAAIDQYLGSNAAPMHRVVDIGCGGGAGAIVVSCIQPEAEVLAADINISALHFAKVNSALAGTGNIRFCQSNLLNDVDGKFDLIVANPPYLIDPQSRTYRNGAGSLGEGLSLDIVECASERLTPGGTLLLYTGAAIVNGVDLFQRAAQHQLLGRSMHWQYKEIDPDIFGEELSGPAYIEVDRIAAVLLTATKSA